MRKTAISFFIALIALSGAVPMASAENGWEGKVIKRRGENAIYFVSSDGTRYVFPNEKIYFSWYPDFSSVVELNDSQLATIPLAGAVQYRPGVVLVKIQTDPKVYAVSQNGKLRWVKTEALAKKLYGDNWNLLVDDIPDSFFAHYSISAAIEDDDDFDPDDEEDDIRSIDANRLAKIERKIMKSKLNFCEKAQKQLNKIQSRLARRGVTINGVGDNFIQSCVEQVQPGNNDKKVVICHVPPGNPAAKQTLIVGASAAKAHLSHGDTLGRCDADQSDTTAPVISSVSATTTSATSAQVTWTTNEVSNSKVTYATSSLAVATNLQSVSGAALVTSHSLMLTGLSASTQYFFRVESADAAGNTATSTQMTFTTPSTTDTSAPVISAIVATAATSTATITWNTNESSNSEVKYSTQVLATATSTNTVVAASLVTAHSIQLTGLTPSTTYYYMVKSADGSGNIATSTEHSFTTQALPAADVTPPIISALTTITSSSTALVTWTTNEPSSSEVIYAGADLDVATSTQSVVNAGLTLGHALLINGLNASTTYHFKVKSTDAAGNTASSTQSTFLTTN